MTLLERLSNGWKAYLILFAITFTAGAPGVFNLPALDRDESRFAQASKQYIETGDYLIIRYQDEFRNKKPAGIHWLQAGSTALLGDGDNLEVWTYRVPSWLGVALASMATFWAGIVLIGRRPAFLGALMFGATFLITSEAHISKTDGVLVFLTALGIGALARLYMRRDQSKRMALLFWFVIGCGLLIKGPVMPMVAAYAGFGAWVWARAAGDGKDDWWRALAWWPGPVLALAMFLPWLVAIQFATGGEFLQGAVGKDLKDKFAGASEGHAGWPFYHLSHVPIWFFPATLLAIPATVLAWNKLRGTTEETRQRGNLALIIAGIAGVITALAAWIIPGEIGNGAPSAYPTLLILIFGFLSTRQSWHDRTPAGPVATDRVRATRFLASWAILTLLFFELMPTKLSHYIMPAYPAFALLCGWAAMKMIEGAKMPVSKGASTALFALGGVAFMLISSPLAVRYFQENEAANKFKTVDPQIVLAAWEQYAGFPMWMWAVGGAAFVAAMVLFIMHRINGAIIAGIAASLFLGWHARTDFLPTQTWLQPTESAILALEEVCGLPSETCADGRTSPARILAVGYAEPSYVLTTGTQNLHPPETPIGLPDDDAAYPIVYLLNMEDKASAPALAQMAIEAAQQGRCVTQSDPVYALNYSNGDPVNFIAVRYEAGC